MPPGPYRATTCRGRELNCGSHTYFSDHTRTWRASPDEWSAQCRGHLRDSTNMRQYTPSTQSVIPTRRIWNDDDDGQMILGDLGGLKLHDICLTGEEKPRKKPHPENLSRPGIELGPAAWQARMLPLAPQRWTLSNWLAFKEPGGSLPPLQKPSIGPYLEQDQSNLQHHNPPSSNPF